MKLRFPDEIKIFDSIDNGHVFCTPGAVYDDVKLSLDMQSDRLSVHIAADTTPLLHIRFRWNFTDSEIRRDIHIMGDAWERSYGELEWRGEVPHRFMPWYMLVTNGSDLNTDTDGRYTEVFGVGVQPSAMCSWQHDPRGVTLWMDVRSGGVGVILGGRELHVCDVFMREYVNMSAFEAGRSFCTVMCPSPLKTEEPVYGFNNWYYAVGHSSHEQILKDCDLICEVTEGLSNRPYMVVDDGWQRIPCSGPWNAGCELFPDMPRLAREITERGAVPGIWVRYLRDEFDLSGLPAECYLNAREKTLDASHPLVIEYIKEVTKRLVSWGYRFIKHDFSMPDIYGVDGFKRGGYLAENGWSFYDKSRTSAEIALHMYRTILEAAGDGVIILACDTPSHLTAGVAHLMRTGFDTSSRHFERTRISGVNTLAFRLMQNGTFYAVDADCVGHSGRIDWKLNREWLRLVAESGTTLFISADPDLTTEEMKEDMHVSCEISAKGKQTAAPLDWMENQTPEVYLINGEVKTYDYYAEEGTHQFIPPTDQQY